VTALRSPARQRPRYGRREAGCVLVARRHERRRWSAAPLVVAGARIADCAAPGGGSGVFLQVAAAGLVAAGLILERNAAAAGFGGRIASGGGAALGPGVAGYSFTVLHGD
jgi:hypothetical protein